ncbi:Flp family type IVb pilin [Massilia sp. MB5]|uniref:Flp family type IVb pilin n=1 Tax=unclassified Massilia TaxID=2609279 RepID=UPI0009E222B4|nr:MULTISPECIES: Flp family type IVb pilin [unclassified Massilia]UMR32102.1 Flp family type IVb pilin [Massilia sp. MB5]
MDTLKQALSRFARDEEGATAIEYGLIAALMAAAIVAALALFTPALLARFTNIAALLTP